MPPHPHTGLQTVTWLLERRGAAPGQRRQRAAGPSRRAQPDDGRRGIAHAETSRPGAHRALRGVQLWIALPDASAPDRAALRAPRRPAVEAGRRRPARARSCSGGSRGGSPATTYSADRRVPTSRSGPRGDRRSRWSPVVRARRAGAVRRPRGRRRPRARTGRCVYLGCGRHDAELAALGVDGLGAGGAAARRRAVRGGAAHVVELRRARRTTRSRPARRSGKRARVDGGRDQVRRRGRGYDGAALPAPRCRGPGCVPAGAARRDGSDRLRRYLEGRESRLHAAPVVRGPVADAHHWDGRDLEGAGAPVSSSDSVMRVVPSRAGSRS